MVHAEDAVRIYNCLAVNGIQVWILGGWGIDALVGKETRPHKDIDLIMLLEDVVRMREVLNQEGWVLKELWSENRWAIDAHGNKTATAFVLQDLNEHEIDAHAMVLDDQGNGIPAWETAEGDIFSRQDLAGVGLIAGCAVRCITPERQMLCHTGYELPEKQFSDLELLHEKFGVEYPDEYLRLRG
jgi:lincosamide nucleotidyltransferase A/C/D/E